MPIPVSPPAAAVSIAICVALAACASTAIGSERVIVTLAPGVRMADAAAFEREVLARTSVEVSYVAAVSERMHALIVICAADDAGCARAKQKLAASGLFSSLTDDRRRGRY